MNTERVRNDFDQIARLSDCHGVGSDRYDSFLLSLVPVCAVSILDVGCGLGRLAVKLASDNREVTGVDLSPEMIAPARKADRANQRLMFLCGDFLERNFTAQQFDCVISAAALHHMPEDIAVTPSAPWRPAFLPLAMELHHRLGQATRGLTNFQMSRDCE